MFNFGHNQQGGQPRYLNRKHSRIVIQDGLSHDEFFRTEKDTILDPGHGLITTEVMAVPQVGCGHALRFPEDLGMACRCGKTLCRECSSVRCGRCLEVYCSTCLELYDGPKCRSCRRKEQLRRGLLSFLRGLHNLLAKEF